MSKCSTCNQTLPALRAVTVACGPLDSEVDPLNDGRAWATCYVSGSEDTLALKNLVNSGYNLVLVTEKQLKVAQNSDQGQASALVRQLLEDLRKEHTELLANNDELSSRLADIRRVAFL